MNNVQIDVIQANIWARPSLEAERQNVRGETLMDSLLFRVYFWQSVIPMTMNGTGDDDDEETHKWHRNMCVQSAREREVLSTTAKKK